MSMSQHLEGKSSLLGVGLRGIMMLGSSTLLAVTLLIGVYKAEIAANLQTQYLSRSDAARLKLLETTGLGEAARLQTARAQDLQAVNDKLASKELPPLLDAQKQAAAEQTAAAKALAITTAARVRSLRDARASYEPGSLGYERLGRNIEAAQRASRDKTNEAAAAQKSFEADRLAYLQALRDEQVAKTETLGQATAAVDKAQTSFAETRAPVESALQRSARPDLGAMGRGLFAVAAVDPSLWLFGVLFFLMAAGLEVSAVLSKYNLNTTHQKLAFAAQRSELSSIENDELRDAAYAQAVQQYWKSPIGLAHALHVANDMEVRRANVAAIDMDEKALGKAMAAHTRVQRALNGHPLADAWQGSLRERLKRVLPGLYPVSAASQAAPTMAAAKVASYANA